MLGKILETLTKKRTSGEPSIMFYDSASTELKRFVPRNPTKKVRMYSCGNTVYDYAHIGNLSSFLLPDLIIRLLRHDGYTVENTINFTDFGHLTDDADEGEDKMMKALKRNNKPVTLDAMKEVAQIYIEAFKKDFERFDNIAPTHWTPASEYVEAQIRLIETLEEKGYAYETPDGVYFDVTKFPAYGKLGNVDIQKIKEGARVEANPHKHHPADFALWKKGLLGWESRWGKGFPGWHIECTAMAFATLGKEIDIHTGGEDLKYTHHNGEIAQAEAATGRQYVRYWMHAAHLSVDAEKIAKSLGNGILLDEIENRGFSPFDFRFLLLQSHYRSPMNFTWDSLEAAHKARTKLLRAYTAGDAQSGLPHKATEEKILTALRDDLGSARAIAALFELLGDESVSKNDTSATLALADSLLGLGFTQENKDESESATTDNIPEDIQKLLDTRKTAREEKDWETADRIRDELKGKGYTVTDTPDGQKIESL